MRKRLNKCCQEYLAILYIIWQLVEYYSVLFQVDAGKDPARSICEIYQNEGITFLRFSFPKIIGDKRIHTVVEICDIYNDYLRMALLPAQKTLRPYHGGKGIYDVVEALYVDMVYEDCSYINLEIVYVDNKIAYDYVRKNEGVRFYEG